MPKYAVLSVVCFLSCCGCSETASKEPEGARSQVHELQASKKSRKALPKELEYFSKHKVLTVTFAHKSDRATTENVPAGFTAYQVKKLVKMDTGKLVVPMFLIKRPRKGTFGKVYQTNAWVSILVAVGNRGPLPRFHLPIDTRIKKHLLLLRPIIRPGLVSDAPWRVFEFNAAKLNDTDELQFPKFETLPVLKDRADGAAIQKQIDDAVKARSTIDLWET